MVFAQRPKKILLVKNRAMGDSLMGLSTVLALKSSFPDCQIYYALPSWIVPLFKELSLSGVKVVALDLKSLKGLIALFCLLFKQRFDAIYEMHQSGGTKKVFSFFSFLFRLPYGAHNHHLKTGTDVIDQGVIKPLIQRDLDGVQSFFKTIEIKLNYLDFPPRFPLAPSLENSPKKQILILGVVATRETKMYPLEHYLEVLKKIRDEAPAWKIVIPLSKSQTDLEIASRLRTLGFEKYAEIVNWSLAELPSRFTEASLYLGNDTGLKHLAVCLELKTFTLFGPEPPLEWHPYDVSKHFYFYREGLECRTLTAHYCGLAQCDSMICLNQIMPSSVFEKISPYLK